MAARKPGSESKMEDVAADASESEAEEESEEEDDRNKKGLHQKQRLTVVLARAGLKTVKTKHGYELATADKHGSLLKRHGENRGEFRPDIVHRALLALLDSPLNKAGHLKVFVHTEDNVLIEVSPHVRLPRTFSRFSALMVQLLRKMKIKAAQGNEVLMKVIKNPITQHLPAGALKIGTSVQGQLVQVNEWSDQMHKRFPNKPIVLCIGGHAHGPVELDWVEEQISISSFALSSSAVCARFTAAFEKTWGVL